MKRFALLLPLLLGGACAKFPDGGGNANFTRVRFTMRFRGPVDTAEDASPLTSGVYIVALRATPDLNPVPQTAPVPVYVAGSPNGFVAGSPTHFVRFLSENPLAAYPYVLNRFAPGPGPGDPDNDVNLASFFDQTPAKGPLVNFVRPSDGDPNVLQFDVFVNQLADSDTLANGLNRLQVNLLSMNKLSTAGISDRSGDSLGDNRSPDGNQFVSVDLRTSNVVRNLGGLEPPSDTFNGDVPSLDLVDFEIEVIRP